MSASRSTALADHFLATVDQPIDRAAPVHVVHAGRPGDRPDPVLAHAADCLLIPFGFRSLCYLPDELKNSSDVFYFLLSPLPIILHLGKNFLKLQDSLVINKGVEPHEMYPSKKSILIVESIKSLSLSPLTRGRRQIVKSR